MSNRRPNNHKEEINDNSNQAEQNLNPNEIQNMLKNVDMREIQKMLGNVNMNEIQNSLKNIDVKQLAFIINIINSLSKNKK